jgi:LysM repeat protein
MKLKSTRPTAKIRRKNPPVKLNATAARRRSRVEEFDDEEEEYYETSEPNMKLSHAFIVVLILHLIAVAGVFGFNSMKNRQNALAKISEESAAVQTATAETAAANTREATATSGAGAAATAPTASAASEPATHTVAAGDTLYRIAAKYNTTIEALEQSNGLTAESILRVGQVLTLPGEGTAKTTTQTAVTKTPPAPVEASTTKTTASTATSTTPPAPTTSAAAANKPAETSSAASTTPPASAGGEAAVYEVVAGDNPYSIARSLGVSYQDLLQLNNIEDPTKLQIGQKLKVPGR